MVSRRSWVCGLMLAMGLCVLAASHRTWGSSWASGWTYIRVDSTRPHQSYGLAWGDFRGSGYQDIVSGPYFYRSPLGDLTGKWSRETLPGDVDAMLVLDVDSDGRPDIIAEKLPEVFWLKPGDEQCHLWSSTHIGTIRKTGHGNGQGCALGQLRRGGKPQIILAHGGGIDYFEVPADPKNGNWPRTHVTGDSSDEGVAVGDVNRDGTPDIIASEHERGVAWYENPKAGKGTWVTHRIGSTANHGDRFGVADINADGRLDIVVAEETLLDNASVFWFEQPGDPKSHTWPRHKIVTQFTTNSMDIADMDGDGRADVVTGEHRGSKKLAYWTTADRGATWTEHVISQGIENHLGARVVDLDGDGDLDVLGIAWDKYQDLHLWRNDAKAPGAASLKH